MVAIFNNYNNIIFVETILNILSNLVFYQNIQLQKVIYFVNFKYFIFYQNIEIYKVQKDKYQE